MGHNWDGRKVARSGHFLSNVAQGGSVHPLEEIFSQVSIDQTQVEQHLKDIALAMVHYLDLRLPHIADIGFDFGIDVNGHPYFIEMNGRDQRYSFAKANMLETWKGTYEKPIAYARYLINGQHQEG
jgi:hypothetical protein